MQSAPPADTRLEGVEPRFEARGASRDSVAHEDGNPSWVLLAALAGMFATTFPITILTVSLGSVAREFGTSETTIAWVISAPMLLSAVALPLLGKLGDLYGHRRIFLLGFAGATVTAGLTALAWSPFSLIGLRTLAAVLGGATQPASMALIFAVYPPERRVRAMGWWSMTGAAAPALGLLAGGPLVDHLGWRIVFVLQAGFSLLAWIVAALVLRETPRQRVRFDLLGGLALALGVGGLMYALGQARDSGLTSVPILLAVAVGIFGVVSFVKIERRVESPLLPLTFFQLPGFTAAILANSAMSAAYMGAFVIAPLVLLEEFGFTISVAAGIMLLRTASLTIASPFGGSLGQRSGERVAAVVGSSVMTAGLALVCAGAWRTSLPLFGVGLVLQGVGHGLALPSLTSAISHSVAESDLGVASAANRLTGQIGAAFGITLLAIVYGGRNEPAAFGTAFAAGAALSALSVLASAWMRKSHARR